MMVNNSCTIARLAALLFFIQQISGFVVPHELVPENLVFRDSESESGLAINEDVLNQLLKTLYSPSKAAVRTGDDDLDDQNETECYEAEGGDEPKNSHGEEDNGRNYSYQTDNSNCYQQSTTEVSQNSDYSQLPQKNVQPQETTGFHQQMNSYQNTGEQQHRGWNQQTMAGFGQREQLTNELKNQHFAHGTQQDCQQKSVGRMLNIPQLETTQRTLAFNGCQPVHRGQVSQPQQHPQQQQQQQQQQEPRRRLQIGTVSVRHISPA